MLILLISACSSKTNQAKTQSEATQNMAVVGETPAQEKSFPQELGKLVAAKEKMSGLQLISLNN